jgi:hypothetical protein
MHLDDYQCVLCQLSTEQTVMHLLFYCPLAKNCWSIVNFSFANDLSVQQIFQAWKSLLQTEFSLDIFILFCWRIWMMRNDVIFRNKVPSVEACKSHITVRPYSYCTDAKLQLTSFRIMDQLKLVVLWIFYLSFSVP